MVQAFQIVHRELKIITTKLYNHIHFFFNGCIDIEGHTQKKQHFKKRLLPEMYRMGWFGKCGNFIL